MNQTEKKTFNFREENTKFSNKIGKEEIYNVSIKSSIFIEAIQSWIFRTKDMNENKMPKKEIKSKLYFWISVDISKTLASWNLISIFINLMTLSKFLIFLKQSKNKNELQLQ